MHEGVYNYLRGVDMDSILTSIKKMLGPSAENTDFDTDIIIDINSAFMVLRQLGIGPADGFSITDSSSEWTDFIEDMSKIEAVKSYVYLKTKLLFDPPSSSTVLQSINENIKELESRLNYEAD